MKKLLSILVCIMIAMSSFGFIGCDKEGSLFGGNADVTYTITVDAPENGTLTASKTKAVVGESVTFTVTPQTGYVLAGLYLNGSKVDFNGNQYTVKNVLRDYSAEAVFAKDVVTVSFDGEGTSGFGDKTLSYGDAYGELPTPLGLGKTFAYWQNEKGEAVTDIDTVDAIDGSEVLTAVFTDMPESLKAMHTPFSITTTYYDAAATKYGVTWHTRQEPIAPKLFVVEGDGSNFDNAVVYDGEKMQWLTTDYGYEWIIHVVIENLKFDTTYSVKFGDYCVNAWSKVFTFTTREEYNEDVEFIYITDTQENQHVAHQNGVDTYMSQVMIDAVAKFPNADFIAHGGDYVNDAQYPCRWEEMIDSVDEYLFTYPTQIAAGNHADPTSYANLSNRHTVDVLFNVDSQVSDEASTRGSVYSFDYGPMHFVVLASNDALASAHKYAYSEEQIAWFIEDMQKANANPDIKWTVVMVHQGPIWPSFTQLNSNSFVSVMGPQIIPIMDELNLDLVLYGHNHYIDSTYPLVWDDSITEVGVDNLKVKPATKTIEKVSFDGDTVDKFVYASANDDRGTVFHQIGAAGNQVTGTTYKWSELEANLAKLPNYRMLLSGASSATPVGKNLQMYAYVQVDQDSLVVRTYGVEVDAQIKDATFTAGEHRYYLDGFMLAK